MTTTPNFRALSAELLSALETEGYTHWTINPGEDPLCERARAALATPPPEAPTDDEIADVWLTVASEDRTLSSFGRAVLERWGQ